MNNLKYHFYTDLANFYDDFYRFKKYKDEVEYVHKIFKSYKNISADNILDIGCGTAEHLKFFSKYFKHVYGIDPNAPMLKIAKSKLRNKAKFFLNPIQTFTHKPIFSLITSFNSALNYIIGYKELEKSIKQIYALLTENGITILQFHNNTDKNVLFSAEARDGNDKLLVLGDWQGKNKLGLHCIDFFYHLNSKGKWKTYHDAHKEYLFSKEQIKKAMKTAGFKKIKIIEATKNNSPFITSEFICCGKK